MRDGVQRQVIDTRQPGTRAARDARQFAAETRRQVALGRSHLFLDEVEVVEQPLAGRRDTLLLLGALCQQRAGFGEHLLVVAEPAQQAIAAAPVRQLMPGSQVPAMLFHFLGGEQLRAQRRVVVARGGAGDRRTAARPQPRPQPRDQSGAEPILRVHNSFVDRPMARLPRRLERVPW